MVLAPLLPNLLPWELPGQTAAPSGSTAERPHRAACGRSTPAPAGHDRSTNRDHDRDKPPSPPKSQAQRLAAAAATAGQPAAGSGRPGTRPADRSQAISIRERPAAIDATETAVSGEGRRGAVRRGEEGRRGAVRRGEEGGTVPALERADVAGGDRRGRYCGASDGFRAFIGVIGDAAGESSAA
jgi:hypothetical protein